jgi:hypothetical protein
MKHVFHDHVCYADIRNYIRTTQFTSDPTQLASESTCAELASDTDLPTPNDAREVFEEANQ